MIRPGGRSERIQIAVHQAVRELRTGAAGELTVALIAARADVTPSTIYRRWGSIEQLLAAVASENFHPDAELVDTGTLKGDLQIWLANFVDDISTGLGRSLLQERVADVALARTAAGYAFENFETLVARARTRDEGAPAPDRLMDLLVAPVLYRLVFAGQAITKEYEAELIDFALEAGFGFPQTNSQPSIRS